MTIEQPFLGEPANRDLSGSLRSAAKSHRIGGRVRHPVSACMERRTAPPIVAESMQSGGDSHHPNATGRTLVDLSL